MDDNDDELFSIFRDEATDALEELAAVVDRISAAEGDVPEPERDAALRILHNIKGAARIAGSEAVETIAHTLEEALGNGPDGARLLRAEAAHRLRLGMGLVAHALGEGKPAEAAPPEEAQATRLASADSHEEIARDPSSVSTVRIEASRLDTLMQFVGEIMAAQARMHERNLELERAHLALAEITREASGELGRSLAELERSLGNLLNAHRQDVQRFSHLSRDWSAAIKRARLSPLSSVVPQWRRTVAETAHEKGREARLVADVGDIEIDRQILDGLRDPIMHLLRNAVAHGIEPPEARARAGKPRVGTIRVRARAPGMMVELEVSDDGCGLNPERIAERAAARGLATADHLSRTSTTEILEMVFLPGFSTTESVDRVSGRGVGLDIVKQRLADLGGQARIGVSALGGATFCLDAPATVVSTKGLLVRYGQTNFVLPLAYVTRTLQVPAAKVRRLDGMAAVEDALGEPIRLQWLSSLSDQPRRAEPAKLLVVTLSNGASHLGLVVDEVVGEVESVTKRLPWNVPRVPGVAGAMILGTGVVAVVLDVPRLFGGGVGWLGDRREETQTAPAARTRRILVVDDSLTSRTLERNILVAAGYEVDTANDGEMAWQALQVGHYDLVVSDVQMPALDGVDLTRRIRAHARLHGLPVILVTSLDRPADLARGTAAGADEYIVKGRFNQRALLEAVTRLL